MLPENPERRHAAWPSDPERAPGALKFPRAAPIPKTTEPNRSTSVRLRYCLFLGLLTAGQASAITFQTRLEQVEWRVEGDQFECRLSQAIAGFGVGEFVRRAGEQATFRLKSSERWFDNGSATLLAAAAPWQPSRGDWSLGQVAVGAGETPFNSTQLQAGRLLTGLLEGRGPLVRHRTRQGGDPLEVRLSPARFGKAYDDYLACTAKLLPVNYDQIRQSQIGFPSEAIELDDLARAKLDIILDYVKADPSINRFQLDGHSDNSGNRLTNRELSRNRALAVQAYLVSRGIAPEQITLRFHGERYPLVPNSSKANRATNRRVTLRLDREPPQAEAAQASATTADAS
ncbi:OmpA family protein [Stutzerimonas urumqiensis]